MKNYPYTGQSYQLKSLRKLPVGAYVEINGPWDKFGIVTSSSLDATGEFLNQIRGCRQRMLSTVVARF